MRIKSIQVVVGVLFNTSNEILLSSRPEGKSYTGYWEFAGGKVEAAESKLEALKREFKEELDIDIIAATPWLRKQFSYEHAHVDLWFYRVSSSQYQGEPRSLEGQVFAWQNLHDIQLAPLLPANISIIEMLKIPTQLYWDRQNKIITDHQNYQISYTEEIYLHYIDIKQDLHFGGNVWSIIWNKEQFDGAIDSQVVIWMIDKKSSVVELMNILQEDGMRVPIIACTQNIELRQQLYGVHGLITLI